MTRTLAPITYWTLAAFTFAAGIALVFAWTPEESTMGIIQKIFYFHLPLAINTFLACTVVFAGGIGYLAGRNSWWDDLASAAAKVAVILCTGVLLTGMIWGHSAWGVWWTWSSPRLTFSFMLWLLFIVYLIVRASIENRQRRAVVSAIYGIIAYLDIPLIYLSARLIPDIHPGNISLVPSMKLTLALSFIPITLVALGLLVVQYKVHRAQRTMELQRRQQALAETDFHPSLAGGTI